MTNRKIINFAKDNGFVDVTRDEYDSYDTASGKMRQMCQKDYLTLEKKIGGKFLRITVQNDRWSFNGLNEEDRVRSSDFVWFNEGLNNETNHREGAVIDIKLRKDSLVVDYRVRRRDGSVITRTDMIFADEEY